MLSCSVLILDKNQWYPFFGAWILAFIFETLIVTLTLDHMRPSRPLEHVQVALEFVRVGLLALLLAVFFSLRGYRHSVDEEETAPLLASSHESSAGSDGRQSGFGTIGSNASDESAAASANEEALAKEEKKQNERYAKLQEKVRQNGNWWTYLREYRIFVPLIWPTGKPLLQVYMVIVGICVLAGRAFAILVPRQLGILTTSLAHGQLHSSFVALAIYVGLRALRSDAGLEGLRSILWNSVESNAFQTLETASFNHIMDLSCDFHDEKQSGELYTAMTQGAALVRLLDVLLYHIGPTSLDLLLACIYFYFLMDAYLVLIGGAVATFYYATSLYIAAYQRRLWRQSNVLNRRKYQIQYDTMGGWRTVTYFNRIPHAQTIYATVVKLYRSFRVKANQIEQLQDGFQTLILNFGAFTAFTLGVYRVAKGKSEVGDFITLVMYWDTFLGKCAPF